uniref:Ovule protein n=1 Tax=Heterorhabditis bacteriophora TaxID=37862 RepID=A0A1I7XF62_HETBA
MAFLWENKLWVMMDIYLKYQQHFTYLPINTKMSGIHNLLNRGELITFLRGNGFACAFNPTCLIFF